MQIFSSSSYLMALYIAFKVILCGCKEFFMIHRKICMIFLQVLWYQDSFLLDATDRRTMDSRGDRHILTIRNIQQSDFGNYR